MPRSGGEMAIPGQQSRSERFGESDIDGVVSRQVVPQLPNPRQQHVVLVTTQRKVLKRIESVPAASGIEFAGRFVAAQHLSNLEIDQMRRVQRQPLAEQPLLNRR